MKCLKVSGLAAITIVLWAGLASPSAASPSVLCTTTATPCEAVEVGTFSASQDSGTSTVLESTSGSIEDTCNSSTIGGSIKNSESSPVAIQVTDLTFSECTNTTTVNNSAACELEIKHIAATDNGTVIGKGCTWTVNLFGVNCSYGFGTETDLGTLTGGKPATLDVNTVLKKIDESKFLCPETVRMRGNWAVTTPGPNATLHVEPEGVI